jgi:hypothetical protein
MGYNFITLTVDNSEISDQYNLALRDRFNRLFYPGLTLVIISFITMLSFDLLSGDFSRMKNQFWFLPQILFFSVWGIAKCLGSLWAPYSIFIPIISVLTLHHMSM